jgi:hypothetical protein
VVAEGSLDASSDAADATSAGDAGDAGGFGIAPDDAFVPDPRRYTDAPTFATDAACVEDALAGEAGTPFSCGGVTCWSGASYCGLFRGGRILPQIGCHPLPCNCAPNAGCGCVDPLPGFCNCDLSGGGVTVRCDLP